MLSADELDAYDTLIDGLSESGQSYVRRMLGAWAEAHPGYSVADMRDYAIGVLADACGTYGESCAGVAADFYEGQAADANVRSALVEGAADRAKAERVVRYKAQKLAAGDYGGFVSELCSYLDTSVRRTANLTTMANAKRDRRRSSAGMRKAGVRGVRFARIPRGGETCTFCVMLASRGAVYHSRDKAGLMRRFHRGCKCKVVPGYGDDPMRTLVEGHDPHEAYDLWKRYEEVNADGSLTDRQRAAVKLAWADSMGMHPEPTELADTFEAALKQTYGAFTSNKTIHGYDDTMGALLKRIGEPYGLELSGERFPNRKGHIVGARPDGDELWSIVKHGKSGFFLYATRSRKRPDFETGDGLIEIKTPKSPDKINDLLVNASRKFLPEDAKKKQALMSLLRLPNASSEAKDAARRFTEDGTFDNVFVDLGE